MFFKKNKLSLESVGKIALTVTLITSVALTGSLYEKNEEIKQLNAEMMDITVLQKQAEAEIDRLDNEKSKVVEERDVLLGQQDELALELDKFAQENSDLKAKLKKEQEKSKIVQASADRGNLKSVEPTKKPEAKTETPKKETVQKEKPKPQQKASGEHGNWKKMTVESTAYSLIGDPTGSDGTPYTATGTYPKEGRTIAVDPRVIPYGTEVYIPALGGTFIAEDTGGAIKGNKVDIYMSTGDKARQWGRRTIEIYVKP